MPDTNNPAPNTLTDSQTAETRMRRALGLHGGGGSAPPPQQRPEQARQRHRFAQDGSVPVVMLNGRGDAEASAAKERIATLDAGLEAERAAHAVTRRTLQETQAANQALQTRLAHADLAHGEALVAERQARKQAEDALAATTAPRPALAPMAARPMDSAPKPPRKPRANAAPPREPKPVKWWTPGFRAKARKP